MNDTCNAIVRKGDNRYICEKKTGHVHRGDRDHEQTTVTALGSTKTTWQDSSMGGETVREF